MEKIPDTIKKEIEKLVTEINGHNYRYHVLDDPVIPDAEGRLRDVAVEIALENHDVAS